MGLEGEQTQSHFVKLSIKIVTDAVLRQAQGAVSMTGKRKIVNRKSKIINNFYFCHS